MTNPQPVTHGYPDWGRTFSSSDILLVTAPFFALNALKVYPPMFVGNLPFISIRLTGNDKLRVTIDFCSDAAGTNILSGGSVTSAAGGTGFQCVPVAGPYVVFTLESTVYPTTAFLESAMVQTQFNVPVNADGSNNLIEVKGTAVAGASTTTVNASQTRGGWAYWVAEMEAAVAFRMQLYAVGFSGTTYLLDTYPFSQNGPGHDILIPAMPLRLVVDNNDAVARTLYTTVTFHPFKN